MRSFDRFFQLDLSLVLQLDYSLIHLSRSVLCWHALLFFCSSLLPTSFPPLDHFSLFLFIRRCCTIWSGFRWGFRSPNKRIYSENLHSLFFVCSAFVEVACCLPPFWQLKKPCCCLTGVDSTLISSCCSSAVCLVIVFAIASKHTSHAGACDSVSAICTGTALGDWSATSIVR